MHDTLNLIILHRRLKMFTLLSGIFFRNKTEIHHMGEMSVILNVNATCGYHCHVNG